MNVNSPNPIPHSGTPHSGQISPFHQAPHAHEMNGHVTAQTASTAGSAAARFTPHHVFNHWVMNMMNRSVAKPISLQDRHLRSKVKRSDSSRRTKDGEDEEEIDPVGGRVRPAEISLALNLMRHNSGDDQRNQLEEELKVRKLTPLQRQQVYVKAAQNVNQAGFSPEDAQRVRQALDKSAREVQSHNRHDLRKAMHDPEKLREAIEIIAGPIEKLTAVMRRELRIGFAPDRPHVDAGKVDVPFMALSLLKFTIAMAGPEHCKKALAAYRTLWKSEY